MLTVKAYAKINLTLEVLGRRDDGYHDVTSVMQTIGLFDTLTVEPDREIVLECDVAELRSQDNLAAAAARLLRESTGCGAGARIRIEKGIPVSAGLGGGSSDAAAALRALNALWGLGLSTRELEPLAAQLGSDVPFFLHNGTAMVHGWGERVRPLPPADLQWMVVLSPDIRVPRKTAALYGMLDRSSHTRGALTRKLEARIRGGGDAPPQFLFNVFDAVAFDAYPGLDEYWRTLESLGAREIHLAGSGPSMFAPVSRREVGTALDLLLKHRHGWRSNLVSTVSAEDAGRLMSSMIAGASVGLLMASIFVSAGAVMLFVLSKATGPPPILERLSPVRAALSGVAAAYPAWGIVGAVMGLLYEISVEQAPGAGMGSPNLVFTLSVLLVTVLMAAPFVVLLRRVAAGVLVMALSFIALFGWFLPFFAR